MNGDCRPRNGTERGSRSAQVCGLLFDTLHGLLLHRRGRSVDRGRNAVISLDAAPESRFVLESRSVAESRQLSESRSVTEAPKGRECDQQHPRRNNALDRRHDCEQQQQQQGQSSSPPAPPTTSNYPSIAAPAAETPPTTPCVRDSPTLTASSASLDESDVNTAVPSTVLVIIASFVSDRSTFNALASVCREVSELCARLLVPPWPEVRLRIGAPGWSLCFSKQGHILACGGGDGKIRLWHRRSGPIRPLVGHLGRLYAIQFSPTDNILASGSADGDLRLWNLDNYTSEKLMLESPHVDSLAFHPNGNILASGGDYSVRLWDVATKTCFAILRERHQVVEALAFAPNGRTMASGSWANLVSVWDVETRTVIATFDEPAETHALAYSPDGTRLASAGDSGVVRIRSLDGTHRDLDGRTDGCWDVAFSQDGKSVLTANDDGTVRQWDTYSGRCIETWQAHVPENVHAVSVYGNTVASAGRTNYVDLRSFRGHQQ